MARPSRESPTRRSALELAAVKDQPNRDPEERSKKGRPDGQPPLLRDRTEEGDAAPAAERADERDEAKRADEGAPPAEGTLLRRERFAPLFLRARGSLIGPGDALFARLAPCAPTSSPSHRPRLALRVEGADVRRGYDLLAVADRARAHLARERDLTIHGPRHECADACVVRGEHKVKVVRRERPGIGGSGPPTLPTAHDV